MATHAESFSGERGYECLKGGGEMGAVMRSLDWSRTPLGPVRQWAQSLRTSVSTCLNSRFAILIWWGPDLVMLYNDAYRDIIAGKHPAALGCPGRECWPEIWHIIGPMLEGVLKRGEATWSNDLLLLLERNGYPEECYFTFSYSPICDERGEIAGVFTPVAETTDHVIGERRLRTLRDLAARASRARGEQEACAAAAETLAGNPYDIPFAAIYLFDKSRKQASLAAVTGIEAGSKAAPAVLPVDTLPEALSTARVTVIEDLASILGPLPGGAWDAATRSGVVLPILMPGQGSPIGFVLAGVSPRKRLDASYRTFFELVGGQISTAIADARAHEEEQKRLEALAEIDRMKTAFYSNVSHEFRTPLTLMLGPIESMLDRASPSAAVDREELQLVHRNGMRLLKLVNTLLDFSRIEAGRAQGVYEPTELARFTADIASAFRSTMESAGLEFTIDCAPVAEPVFVDRDMWEKIVLNLISNAFKFTLAGGVAVRVREAGDRIEFSVEDTGTGIPEHELAHIFERFHRVEGTRGRTHEGTGIGLALVQELVKLHGGSIRAESAAGKGSRFVVSIPKGHAHLPARSVGTGRNLSSAGAAASAYVDEASRWLPEAQRRREPVRLFASDSVQAPHLQKASGRILLADDNADMRDYVRRLLGSRYEVEVVPNGQEALAAALRNPPDLVLADVMMPGLDGFGLLTQLRANERVRTVPVILLSARAGEDARVEGLAAGADDYMVKPFTARELLARVDMRVAMSRLRLEAAARERVLRAEAEASREAMRRTNEALQVANADLEQFAYSATHDLREPLRAVRACCELLQRKYGGKMGPDADKIIEYSVEGAIRMGTLIDDLLAYIHASAEEVSEPIGLETALEAALLNLQSAIKETGATVTHDPLPAVSVASVHAQQILQNLIGNALKYRSDAPPVVHVGAWKQGASWVFSVRDNGIGIAPEYKTYVFGLFKRLGSEPTHSGTGIGLAICKKLVERYGGRIWVESEEGKGSTFFFSLPEPVDN